MPMPRLPALAAAFALTLSAVAAAAPASGKAARPTGPRCEVKINQPAASVRLNRSKAPPSVCVLGCDARLVGVRREGGQIAALAIYSGRRCRPAGTGKATPPLLAKAEPGKPAPARPKAATRPARPKTAAPAATPATPLS